MSYVSSPDINKVFKAEFGPHKIRCNCQLATAWSLFYSMALCFLLPVAMLLFRGYIWMRGRSRGLDVNGWRREQGIHARSTRLMYIKETGACMHNMVLPMGPSQPYCFCHVRRSVRGIYTSHMIHLNTTFGCTWFCRTGYELIKRKILRWYRNHIKEH